MKISSLFRICPLCQCYSPKISFCCSECKELAFKNILQSNTPSQNYPFELHRLWVWNKENRDLLQKLMTSLKGGHPFESFYTELATKLCLRRAEIFLSPEQTVFIPAPSKNEKTDHSGLLAKSLSQITGAEYKNVLSYPMNHSAKQKNRSRSERQQLKFVKVTKNIATDKRVIFVDDIVTTGSTVQAAFRALDLPANFEVWALAEKALESL